jgi:hypothetical protein
VACSREDSQLDDDILSPSCGILRILASTKVLLLALVALVRVLASFCSGSGGDGGSGAVYHHK